MQRRRGCVREKMEPLHLSRCLLELAALKHRCQPTGVGWGGMIPANTPVIHATMGWYSVFWGGIFSTSNFTGKHNFSSLRFVTGLEWGSVSFSLARHSITPPCIHHIHSFVDRSNGGKKKNRKKINITALAFPRYALAGIILSASFPQTDVDSLSGPRTLVPLPLSCSPSPAAPPGSTRRDLIKASLYE